jgi:hypothetical protein
MPKNQVPMKVQVPRTNGTVMLLGVTIGLETSPFQPLRKVD